MLDYMTIMYEHKDIKMSNEDINNKKSDHGFKYKCHMIILTITKRLHDDMVRR